MRVEQVLWYLVIPYYRNGSLPTMVGYASVYKTPREIILLKIKKGLIFKNFLMKLSPIILLSVSADQGPTDQLSYLVNLAVEFVTSDAFYGLTPGKKGDEFRRRWSEQFQRNADKLSQTFEKCGNENGEFTPRAINLEDSCAAVFDILGGFLRWTNAYLADCFDTPKRGAHIRQERVYERQSKRLSEVLNCNLPTTIGTTTDSWVVTTTQADITTTLSLPPQPTTTLSPLGPHSYYHTLSEEYSQHADRLGDRFSSYNLGTKVVVSSVCNPNWIAGDNPNFGCERIATSTFYGSGGAVPYCDLPWESTWIQTSAVTENGLESWLNCPQCGCVDNQSAKWQDVIDQGPSWLV